MKSFRIVFFLVIICAGSGFFLSIVWESSKDKITEQEKRARMEAVETIFRTSGITEKEVGGEKYWEIKDTGFAFEAKVMGFQDEITAMIGVDEDFNKIAGIVILNCRETPGLGDKITKDKFLSQFRGKTGLSGNTVHLTGEENIANEKIRQMKLRIQKTK